MHELSLFTGAGGGVWASKLLGHKIIGYVEINEYCQKVIRARIDDGKFDSAPIFTDVCEFVESGAAREYRGFADLVSGGIPCQPYSKAAAGKNQSDTTWNYAASAIHAIQPEYVFLENVSKTAIETFAKELLAMGYNCKAMQLSAADMGADHVRKRYWLLAHANDESKLQRSIDAKVAVMPKIRESIWTAKYVEPRMDDGMADRGKRFRAIGNGQVPQVAATAFRILNQT